MHRGALVGLLNLITFSRLLFAVLFVTIPGVPVRATLVALVGITDVLDGWMARRFHLTSAWGAIADPIADHLFVFVAFATVLVDGALSLLEFVIVILRDLAAALAFLVARSVPALRRLRFHARATGKIVTGLQLATLGAVLLAPALVGWLVVAVGLASVVALADYGAKLWRTRA